MSASTCVFLTGVTGFVGGSILSALYTAHPDLRIKALVRQESVAKELHSVFPKIEIIIGDLSSPPLLASTAAEADFAIHAGGDSIPAVCAIIDGLASRKVATGQPAVARLITITGPRSLIDLSKPVTGNLRENERPWSDVTDAHTILNLPEGRIHGDVDKTIIAHSVSKDIGTILVSPGQLWGRGKGPIKKESNAAMYYAAVKKRGRAFVLGKGTATWSWISIGDLAGAVVFLMERSLNLMDDSDGAKAVGVNQDGYYFVSTGDLSMIARAQAVSQRLGLGEVDDISPEEARRIHPMGHVMWGCGERTRADKLAKLGWRPKDVDWKALMEEDGGERA